MNKAEKNLCNGIANQKQNNAVVNSTVYNSQNDSLESVSSFGIQSTSNSNGSMLESSVSATHNTTQIIKKNAYDPNINERINPFDKDKKASYRATASDSLLPSSSITATTTTIVSPATSIDNSGNFSGFNNSTDTTVLSSASHKTSAVPTSSTYTNSNINISAKRDDNVKDRYSTQQGIRDQSQTGCFEMQSTTATNSVSTTLSHSTEVKKQEFGRTKRSSSDADLIFGEKGPDFYKSRFSTAGISRDSINHDDSLADADRIFGTSAVSGPPSFTQPAENKTTGGSFNRFSSQGSRDSSSFNSNISDSDYVFGNKEERNVFTQSLSLSTEKTSDLSAAERFRIAPKAYEPPKSAPLKTSYSSEKWSSQYANDDNDDLK